MKARCYFVHRAHNLCGLWCLVLHWVDDVLVQICLLEFNSTGDINIVGKTFKNRHHLFSL